MAWALLFDGVNDYVQTGTPLNLAVGDTLTVKAKANSGSNYSLVGVELNTTNMIELRPEGVKIRLDSSLSYILSGGGYIKPPIGVYFVVELERISSSLYECRLDGVVIGQIASSLGFIINIFGAIRKIYSFDGEIEYVKNGTVSYWDAAASNHGAGTPILIDTVGGNNATGVNMPTDGSAWLDLGGSGVTVTATETLNSFIDSSAINIDYNVSAIITEVLQPFSDSSLVTVTPKVSITATVTETLNTFSDNSVITITEAGNLAVNVTETLSSFADTSTINVSANVGLLITEVLNSFLDGSNVTISKNITVSVTEVLSSFSDNSFVRLPVMWVDKPITVTNYTIQDPVTTNWTDKG